MPNMIDCCNFDAQRTTRTGHISCERDSPVKKLVKDVSWLLDRLNRIRKLYVLFLDLTV